MSIKNHLYTVRRRYSELREKGGTAYFRDDCGSVRLTAYSHDSSSRTKSTSSNCCYARMVVWFFLLSLAVFYFVVNITIYHRHHYHHNINNDDDSVIASVDAIVTVATCGFRGTDMSKALREKGEWKKPIFVITDEPELEDHTLVTLINVAGLHPSFLNEQEFELYKEGFRQFNPHLWSKWHKSQIFKHIPEDSGVSSVMFMDSDILAQKPLDVFWAGVKANLIDPECELILYPERWYTRTKLKFMNRFADEDNGAYNSGLMILKRTESQEILNEWSGRLVTPPFTKRDQGKLTESINKLDTKICKMPTRLEHIQNLADIFDKIWFRLMGKGTFAHVAS